MTTLEQCYTNYRVMKFFARIHVPLGQETLFCAMWPLLGLAGMNEEDWDPQYNYWQHPE